MWSALPSLVSAQAIVGDATVLDAINESISRRIDLIGIGDSNQIFGGTGWDEGWQAAFANHFEMYATGLISPQQNDGNSFGTGHRYSGVAHPHLVSSGAPPELELFVDDRLGNVHEYGYIETGSASSTGFSGLSLSQVCAVDVSGPLRFDFHYGTFPAGNGSFRPAIRRGSPPYSRLVTGATIPCVADEYGMSVTSLTLPAESRAFTLQAGYSVPGVANVQSPFFGAYVRAVNTARSAGFSYHTQVYLGGRSLRDMAFLLQGASDAYLAHFYSQIRREQIAQHPGLPVRAVFTINSGLNDRNETESSVGPANIDDGDSAGAFADNLIAIMDRIEQVWPETGGAVSEVHFLVVPSHPIDERGSSIEAELQSYRDAARGVAAARERVLLIDMSELITSTEMQASGHYDNNGREHLTWAGYRHLADLMLDELLSRGPCLADVDADGVLSPTDFGAWLAAFNAGDLLADQNLDGEISPTDFGAWLANFNAGCD